MFLVFLLKDMFEFARIKQASKQATISSIRNYEYCNSSLIFFTFLIMCARVTHFNRVECLVSIEDKSLTYF